MFALPQQWNSSGHSKRITGGTFPSHRWKNTSHLASGLDSGLNFRMLARNDEQDIDQQHRNTN